MADFSYQALMGAPVQQVPPGLWDGIAQAPIQAPLSPLEMMLAKQRAQQDPRVMLREINPGMTWGGRDRNAIQPDDIMRSQYIPSFDVAGDVIPIRPPGSPANNAGRHGQIKNQGTQSPNTSAPGSNISRIYG